MTRIVAVTGGSGSGKTTLAKKLLKHFSDSAILGQDSYYIDQSDRFDHDGGSVNFDHPSAIEFGLLKAHLNQLKEGRDIDVPIYDFPTHRRVPTKEHLRNHSLILVDGTLLLSQADLLPLFDESIFIEVDEMTRYNRRLRRDVEERGRTPAGVREQFYNQVKVMHDEFVEPSKEVASLLVRENEVLVQKKHSNKFQLDLIGAIKSILKGA